MTSTTRSDLDATPRAARRRSLSGRFLARLLARVAVGRIAVHTPAGERIERIAPAPGPDAVLVLHRWRTLRRLLFGGDVGFAEAYIDGDWSSPDLPALIEFASRNELALGETVAGFWPMRLLDKLMHVRRANTRGGSRRNIEAHYDLGNAFYATWLDAGMTYSSAIRSDAGQSLEDAQAHKLGRITDWLGLRGGERVLEIGCGWGALAEHLIRAAGCHVTGLTLSPAQLAYARARLQRAGLAAGADLRLQDYRDATGRFDRIVSIEMLEAVGMQYWPLYFNRLRERLAAGGVAVLQVISIAEDRFEVYRRRPDFIQRHIFPGGMLPSPTALHRCIEQAGLALESSERFALGYAATLAEWRRRFHRAWPDLRALGFDEVFQRKWDYYLAYCEAGFRAGAIDVGLYKLRHAAS